RRPGPRPTSARGPDEATIIPSVTSSLPVQPDAVRQVHAGAVGVLGRALGSRPDAPSAVLQTHPIPCRAVHLVGTLAGHQVVHRAAALDPEVVQPIEPVLTQIGLDDLSQRRVHALTSTLPRITSATASARVAPRPCLSRPSDPITRMV